ncbi:40S ribosomal protein S4-3-like [Papaver somniferum]|uniref:40S ribosomal protein S4-3-like n=1 Tax=Papaver somniferum TaxID=3469 RepID=UPI000E6FB121|nr:40S ribosomal protein S4-3-like [Papaver somniferum]
MQRHILVDGKVRTDKTIPVYFSDVISIPKTNENFHPFYDTKGRFRLHSIKDEEAKVIQACKVPNVHFGTKGIPYINTSDGLTIRYPDPLVKANNTIRLDLESNKINFIKFGIGIVVMVTVRRNRDLVGVIRNREKHKGSFDTLHIQDNTGHEFANYFANVFNNGKGSKPWVTLPKGKGIKLIIIKEAMEHLAAQGSATA